MCSKIRFWTHFLWPCLEHLLDALAPQNSPAGPTATWQACSKSHTSDPLGPTEKSLHRQSARRAPFHWLHVLSAQPTGDFIFRCPVTRPFHPQDLDPSKIHELLQQYCEHLTELSEPTRCVWSNILFWKRCETRDWEAALIKTTKYWNTRSIFKKVGLNLGPRPKPPITPIKCLMNAPSTTALANVAQHLQNACLQQAALFRGVHQIQLAFLHPSNYTLTTLLKALPTWWWWWWWWWWC